MKAETMNIHDVEERVAIIAALAVDPESAHAEEDRLYRDLITAIADGACVDPVACCKSAAMVKDIRFRRYYA